MVVSGYKQAFRAFEKIKHTREITMTTIRRIIPHVWSAPQTHGPQDPNQSKSTKSEKNPVERITFLSQVACSVILHN